MFDRLVKYIKKMDFKLKIASSITSVFLIIAVFTPIIFTRCEALAVSPSNIEDVYSGVNIMTPFIAIAAAVLTFMAFWVQYTANDRIHKENKKQQDERQFYKMLEIHRDNVDKLEFVHLESEEEANYLKFDRNFFIDRTDEKRYVLIHSKGQSAIQFFLKELKCIYNVIPSEKDLSKRLKYAYDVFFNGLSPCPYFNQKNHDCIMQKFHFKRFCDSTEKDKLLCQKKISINKDLENNDELPRCSIMNGHKAELNPYYRHLYLTVKLVVESNFEKPDKEKYLKILRASLTAEEQTLLLFNWYFGLLHESGYGLKWENQDQKFFTEWGMIHNIVKKDFEFVEEMNEFEKITLILIPSLKGAGEIEIKKKTKELFNEY